MIVRNHLLTAFGDAARNALSKDISEVALPLRRDLFFAGDQASDVYFMSSGVVSIITTMRDGQAVESLTVGREGAVGLLEALGDPVTTARAMVQIAGSAWRIGAAQLRSAAAQHPIISEVALRYAQVEVAQLHQGAACNAVHDLAPRLARWLLTCEDRIGDAVIPLTQDFLAVMLGVQRTSVTAAAQALQRKGLIAYHRGQITVIDRAGLEHVACECYAASEAVYTRVFSNGSE